MINWLIFTICFSRLAWDEQKIIYRFSAWFPLLISSLLASHFLQRLGSGFLSFTSLLLFASFLSNKYFWFGEERQWCRRSVEKLILSKLFWTLKILPRSRFTLHHHWPTPPNHDPGKKSGQERPTEQEHAEHHKALWMNDEWFSLLLLLKWVSRYDFNVL